MSYKQRYLDLLIKVLTRTVDGATFEREHGADWPEDGAETMIGVQRLQIFSDLLMDTIDSNVPGDVCEAGVWRGGASILAAAVLLDTERHLWVADSFQGVPPPDPRYPADAGDEHWMHSDRLGVPVEEVKENFIRYGLLNERVHFLEGWFEDTLPSAPIRTLCFLRLDGDIYSSTIHTLTALESKVSIGGYVYVDDYGWHGNACQQAVDDYRRSIGLYQKPEQGPDHSAYWLKK